MRLIDEKRINSELVLKIIDKIDEREIQHGNDNDNDSEKITLILHNILEYSNNLNELGFDWVYAIKKLSKSSLVYLYSQLITLKTYDLIKDQL